MFSVVLTTVLDFICGPLFLIPRQFPTDIYTIEKKKEKKMKKGKREKYRCVTALKSKYNKIYRFNKVQFF